MANYGMSDIWMAQLNVLMNNEITFYSQRIGLLL